MITSVKLTSSKLQYIDSKIKAANRTAAKHNLQPITCESIGFEKREVKVKGHTIIVAFYEVVIKGETPIVDGWVFVASVKHTENGNILRSHSELAVPEIYRSTSSRLCEVCHTSRERSETYIIHKDCEFKQVGSSCLKDFFKADIHAIAKFFDDMLDIIQEARRYG